MNSPAGYVHAASGHDEAYVNGHFATVPRPTPATEHLTRTLHSGAAVNGAPISRASSGPPSRSSSVNRQRYPLRSQTGLISDAASAYPSSPQTYATSYPRSIMSERSFSDRLADRSPSPHGRQTHPGAMSEALASRSPGLIRRLSRGARNTIRRRASTQQMMRLQREHSAGPVLMRRRSDSNGASDMGTQDVSDLELDSTAEDPGDPLEPRYNALGIAISRPSDVSSQFEGGIAATDPSVLQSGTELIKLTKKKRKKVKYWLESHSARVCWYGKASLKSFGLDDVVEVRTGADSRNARDDIQVSEQDEERLLTIVYADDRSKSRGTRTLHLLIPEKHIMQLWLDAVNQVVAERVASMQALSASADKSEKAMNLLWKQAQQTKGTGAEETFNLEDARRFCRQLHINCSTRAVQSHFDKADTDRKGTLTYAQYRTFVKSFKERKDIAHVHRTLKHGLDSDLEIDEFMSFLKTYQCIDADRDRQYWENVFEKYSRPAHNRAALPDAEPIIHQRTMGPSQLQSFLVSTHNAPLPPSTGEATLEQPLNEYFISSSHNTYLLGWQVRGTSSVEGYIDALIGGCRCVEIDCWDGENGRPAVTHGRTMTTKIPFEDCVSVIAKYAFHSSPYPLIVSLEVHCNPEQQSAMVDLMVKYFDDMMVTEPILPNTNALPSPEELKNKILIKVKAADDTDQSQMLLDASNGRSRARSLSSAFIRSPSVEKVNSANSTTTSFLSSPGAASPSEAGLASISTPHGSTTSGPTMTPSSSAEESDEASVNALKNEPVRTSKIIPRLGKLGVYTQGISFPKGLGFSDPKAKASNHIFSFSEDTFNSRCKKEDGSREALEKHNVQYLMRVYPGRKRIWSSNFNPLAAWKRGVQMAALNWQTYDINQQFNRAMFSAGSDSLGYVLKPDELRRPKHLPIADTVPENAEKKGKKGKKLVRFSMDVISAQRLPRPRDVNPDAGMNPYIEFEMYAADEKGQGKASGEGGTDASGNNDGASGVGSPLRLRTRTVYGNGFDPIFDDPMSMTVITKHPSLIFVRWTVWHQVDGRKAGSNNVQLATFTAKLTQLQQGYRHLPLYNPQGDKYQDAKLFVKIKKAPPVPAHSEDPAYSFMEAGGSATASPRPEPVRVDRSWPMRIFSRNPSERRRRADEGGEKGLLSRTSSMDRESARA